MELADAIKARGSVKAYDPAAVIDDAELSAIFELVLRSPSSFNLQHWRFVCVREAAARARLQAAAFGQAHVGECSVDVVVCGKLKAHEDAADGWADASEELRANVLPMIESFYADDEQLCRDEAIRSGSMAAMTLMLVAQDRGWSTCPLIGFDPKQVADALGIPADHVPVVLITLGKGTAAPRLSSRFEMSRVVKLESFDGPGLGEA